MSPAHSLLALILVLLPLRDDPLAPDGKRGFGQELEMSAVQKLLHSSEEADVEFLTNLRGLEGEARILLELTEKAYAEADYFDLLDRIEEDDVLRLNEVFFERLEDTKRTFLDTGVFAPPMARLFTDVAFVLRAEILADFELDAQEVRGGLTLIQAHRDGFANLRKWELPILLGRIDLAAARLRALVLDLDLLRKNELWRETAKVEEEALLALAKVSDFDQRKREFNELERTLQKRLERARSTLFSERLYEKIERPLFERARRIETGDNALPEVRRYIPDTEEGKEASEEIAELSKQKRYGYALRKAMEGIANDPFNAELCYFAGLASDFLDGPRESLQWFDRFLALRGIRSHDMHTFELDQLTREERYALDEIQRGF